MTFSSQMLRNFLLLFFLISSSLQLFAHEPNQSYIFLRIYNDSIGGRFEATTEDLNKAIGLDLKEDMEVEELTPYLSQIQHYYTQKVKFSSNAGNHDIVFDKADITRVDLGDYIQLYFSLTNTQNVPENLDVTYLPVEDQASDHKGILVTEYNWKAGIFNEEAMIALVFPQGETQKTLSLTESSVMRGFLAMIWEGIWHIYIGIDHILFLLALVLPSVVRRKKELPTTGNFLSKAANSWEALPKFRPAFMNILKIVTFFTLAHTITLSLAATEVIILPSRFVESIIAFSIALAALHNIFPIFGHKEWIIAFVFGLFHGFGFASVLGDIGLSGEFLSLSLFGFNLGVEIGQILIVSVMFPILFFARKLATYPKILIGGSVLLIIISLYWFIERALDIELPVGMFFYKLFS